MQLRFECHLTGEEYVSEQAWQDATLNVCPLHPQGGCSIARHGTYERVSPPGTRIPRWYCPQGHRTFSLLADCFAARLSGTLQELEAAVLQVEQSPSLEAAVAQMRVDTGLPGVLRWIRRRVKPIYASLSTVKGLYPERFLECEPTLISFRRHLQLVPALPALRDIAATHLSGLPSPLGLRPPHVRDGEHQNVRQHRVGPDPPPALA